MNSAKKNLAIIGAGGHGRVIADCAKAMNVYDEIVFLDDNFPEYNKNLVWSVIGKSADWKVLIDQYEFAIAIGDNKRRLAIFLELAASNATLPNIIHPSAVISPHAHLGKANVVFANSVINPAVSIENACIINTAASIDHDCRLANAVHISPGVHLAGTVDVKACVWFGVGSCSIQSLTIAENCQIGAGATMVKSTEPNGLYLGTPAKRIKELH